jgi:hypothetical protein
VVMPSTKESACWTHTVDHIHKQQVSPPIQGHPQPAILGVPLAAMPAEPIIMAAAVKRP